ncbi:hypothetical protein EKO27_g11167, partial [Xylaria grammica]
MDGWVGDIREATKKPSIETRIPKRRRTNATPQPINWGGPHYYYVADGLDPVGGRAAYGLPPNKTMASRINPWGPLRSLAARTRPLRPQHHARTTTKAALPIGRRAFGDDASMHSSSNDGNFPPPPPTTPGPYTPKWPEVQKFADNFLNAEAIAALEQAATGEDVVAFTAEGLKFGMPTPPAKHEQLQDRHHPVIHQITRILMRDGKLSQAERHVSLILNYLRTSAPPKVSPLRPLLPGSPPPSQLPLNPLLYLTLAIDSVAPIVRVRSLKGMAGGGVALEVPEPIDSRARRRQAIIWILDI